jgi:hypothetical protein
MVPESGSFRRASSRSRRRSRGFHYAAAEVMEERTLLSASATFGSVIGVGSTGTDGATSVATDKAGNRYVTGGFSGTVNFNPNGNAVIVTSLGTKDAYVAKYAPDNTLIWVQRMGGNVTSGGNTVVLDGSGNVYVGGGFSGSGADFGSTLLNSAGGSDGFVTKLDVNGNFQWASRWGTSANESSSGLGLDSQGNVYTSGSVLGGSCTMLKFSPAGATVWSESIATNPGVGGSGFAVDSSGDLFVGGDFWGTVNFAPTGQSHYVSSGSEWAGFVLKLNTNGKFQWVSPFVNDATSANSTVESLALDGSGNVVVGGSYAGLVDFDPGRGTTTLPNGGGFITKLNGSGALVWAKALQDGNSGVFTVYVEGLAVDSTGNIYATGSFVNTIDLNPSNNAQTWTSAGGQDGYVVKFDATGNFVWGTSFGGPATDAGIGIAVDTNGNVDVVGHYEQTANFNPDPNGPPEDLTSAGGYDMFLLQLQQS